NTISVMLVRYSLSSGPSTSGSSVSTKAVKLVMSVKSVAISLLGRGNRGRFERLKSGRELEREQGLFKLLPHWMATVRSSRLVTINVRFWGKADIGRRWVNVRF